MVTKKIYEESKKNEREGNEGSRVCVVPNRDRGDEGNRGEFE